MKVLLSFILFTLAAIGTKAQSYQTSINITFTDIHSIKIADNELVSGSLDKSSSFSLIKGVSVFSSKGSQIRKFNSKTAKTEVLYFASQAIPGMDSTEQFYAENSKSIRNIQNLDKIRGNNPLIVYQIDPR